MCVCVYVCVYIWGCLHAVQTTLLIRKYLVSSTYLLGHWKKAIMGKCCKTSQKTKTRLCWSHLDLVICSSFLSLTFSASLSHSIVFVLCCVRLQIPSPPLICPPFHSSPHLSSPPPYPTSFQKHMKTLIHCIEPFRLKGPADKNGSATQQVRQGERRLQWDDSRPVIDVWHSVQFTWSEFTNPRGRGEAE